MNIDEPAAPYQNWHVWMDDRTWRAWAEALEAEASGRGLEPSLWGPAEAWRSSFEKGLLPWQALEERFGRDSK